MKNKFHPPLRCNNIAASVRFCWLLLCLWPVLGLHAQERTVTGQVQDMAGRSLPGVTVSLKGTSKGAVTDAAGRFTMAVSEGSGTLVFSFLGYETKEVPLNGNTSVTVKLQEDIKKLGELVVVGYGTIKRSDLTGAVASVKAEDLTTAGTSTVQRALQGKVAGVQIESAGGNPGAGARVMIRGVGTLNNNTPLYIVDGVQVTGIDNLAPNDIASIEVLKDASAAAIYGSRAANGVVLVTTKSGTPGKTTIRLNAYYGVQQLAKKLDVLNAAEWARVSNAAHDAAGQARLEIARNPDSLGAGTDWQDEIYRTAPIQSYELSIGGGKEGSVYSVSGGYFSQDGIVEVTGYNRVNLRVKSETTKGRFTFGETAILTRERWTDMPGGWGGQGGNPVGSAVKMIPVFDVYDPTAIGGFAGAYGPVVNVANPVAQLHLESIKRDSNKVITDVYAQAELIKGLTYKINLGYTYNGGYGYDYQRRYKVGTLFTQATNNLTETRNEAHFLMLENTLNYNNTFGKHSIQALAGYAWQQNRYKYTYASAQDLPDGIDQMDAAAGTRNSGGNMTESRLISLLGRVVYSYDNRYLLTASFRRDGSSRFAPANRFGNFPSIALGWNIANEQFFAPLASTINQLKLRASYGVLGNQEIGDYRYQQSIATGLSYVTGIDQHKWFGAIQQSFVDPNIKWENTSTFNIGTDVGLWQSKLTLSADYFRKRTTDILLEVPIPGSAGAIGNPVVNAGIIRNSGFEAGLSYNGQGNNFTWQATATFATASNKVEQLGTGGQIIVRGQPTHHGSGTTTTKVGGEVGAFYLIKTDGIFNSEEEVQAHVDKNGSLIQPNARPGDIRFVDANGDGQISDADKVYCGSPFPDFTYGLGVNGQWKNLDFTVFFQGTYGNKIYNGLRMDLDGMNLEFNYSRATLNAWTPENHTNFPRAVINDPNYNTRVSDRFLENGSYLRLRSLQVGYTIPGDVMQKLSLSSFRAYVSFDNLFTITSYKGYNPDLGRTGNILDRGVDYGHVGYPLARTATVGVQLGF